MNISGEQTRKEIIMLSKSYNVPGALFRYTYQLLPLIIEKECTVSEIRELLKFHGDSYSDQLLLKYLTSSFFKKELDHYMKSGKATCKQKGL